jgi:bifunctional non-homologous end joining protein LigD
VPKPPASLGWLHEVKHDGYRIIARKEGSRVSLWSRYGTNFTDRLPKIAEAVSSLAAESALIDGDAPGETRQNMPPYVGSEGRRCDPCWRR